MGYQKIKTCLTDNTTEYKEHDLLTHLACASLRVTLGMLVINNGIDFNQKKNKNMFMGLLIILIILFTIKYTKLMYNEKLVWKVYQRMIMAYTCAVICIKYGSYKEAGMLMIVDALMGVQSRQISYNLLQCI